jgi:phosphoenolpyruvate---glycerone phosphotransferase subunit DhaL
MQDGLSTASISWAVGQLRDALERSASELNELDGKIGDGDLGATMARAGTALAKDQPNLPPDVGMAFLRCAQTFSRESAGTYGTLMATGLMAVAKATKGRVVVPWVEVSSLLGIALSAMSDRGKAQLGDKTVLDAIEAAREATQSLQDPVSLLDAADRAITAAIDQYRDRPFRQGRARIFSSNAVGLDDPGMIALKRIVEGLTEEK